MVAQWLGFTSFWREKRGAGGGGWLCQESGASQEGCLEVSHNGQPRTWFVDCSLQLREGRV